MASYQLHQVNWNHSLNTHMIDNVWLREHVIAHGKPSIKSKHSYKNVIWDFTYLNCSILYFLRDYLTELTLGFTKLCEIRMVSSITLYTDTPTLFGHTKHKCPPVFRIEISISEYQQTLMLLKVNVCFQVFKNLPCMELLHFSIHSDPGSNSAFPLKIIQIEINVWCVSSSQPITIRWSICIGFNSSNCHASKEDFNGGFHIVY